MGRIRERIRAAGASGPSAKTAFRAAATRTPPAPGVPLTMMRPSRLASLQILAGPGDRGLDALLRAALGRGAGPGRR